MSELTKEQIDCIAKEINNVALKSKAEESYFCGWRDSHWAIANNIANYLSTQSVKFDRQEFLKQCGVKS